MKINLTTMIIIAIAAIWIFFMGGMDTIQNIIKSFIK